MATVRSIIQIIPAQNWSARFDSDKRPPPQNATPIHQTKFYHVPLVCWALVESPFSSDEPGRAVVGMIQKIPEGTNPGTLIFADRENGFVAYDSN
jgi:hypothetical protein